MPFKDNDIMEANVSLGELQQKIKRLEGLCQVSVRNLYDEVNKLIYIACVHLKEVLCNNDVSNFICVIVLLTVYLYLALLTSLICDSDVFAYILACI